MLEFIKKNIFIILIFLITLFVGFITFLTFIDKSFIELNEVNLQYLLLVNIILLLFFFVFVFLEIKKSIKNEIDVKGSKSNKKYITFFALFTLIPSILISIFSLFLFSFALEKYFDKKITTAVNNSYELAKNYVQDVRNKIESDIVMIAFDINKSGNFYQSDPLDFKKFLINQKILRNVDEIHIITDQKKVIMSTLNDMKKFIAPEKKAFDLVIKDDRPLKIINAFENKSAAILKLPNYKKTYVYVVKYLEKDISKYLTESQEALNFYYTVEDKRTGIQISFILIYLIVVSLMLFLSVSIAIRFSSRFFRSINNLVNASMSIGRGNLDTKVPEIKTDKELESLNKNFNLMIDRLKTQQDKLLLTERHEAWENVARKLAHEIKNPLTPIQLIIDRFNSKFSNLMNEKDKLNFNENLKIINKQIKQIENLINEFSDFARMPKPILKKHNIVKIIKENILLMNEIDKSVNISLNYFKEPLNINCDSEQLNRIFTNLFKNSIESLKEKFSKNPDFTKKIDIEILKKDDYIQIIINDNGLGFSSKNLDDLLKPYFTTKSNGTGLGLPIVNKIINDHNGTLKLVENKIGATIKIDLPV
ncbi:ATP-binding protein [Candidatus Pelagibacter sp.]|nr:ATP-binding protein [Candidatus Pelagibacter sp.]